ncbi:hypothetical protein ODZ83_04410 [Acaricomes phytoseiuli]|uniref:hypothetical protein n=1 Tax=Acaricomes phytoseiuli TaxID=291968 RepID=UPI001B7FB9A0|nr:hypothetical protein [Acaricomes phytoseiuli]MCW1249435.1 hypothetical protein [Acaricomes phytoseiuli]
MPEHSEDGVRRSGDSRRGEPRRLEHRDRADQKRSSSSERRSDGRSRRGASESPQQLGRDANSYRRGEERADGKPMRVERPRPQRENRESVRGDGREQGVRDADGRIANPRDLRRSNRPDRERSPDIDEGVTGTELDGTIRAQLRTLETRNGEWVAKHLVMAGRLIDEEPELAFQHALAASRRGGRLAAVREAVGLTAYAAGHYDEALRELRTFRRISGAHLHLPLMADSERGLGRPDRALELAHSPEAAELDAAGRAELAIVAAGARGDQGQWQAAAAELRIPHLDKNRAFSFSPRLFQAYAEVLDQLGRNDEATSWRKQAALAERALGAEEEPEIIDLLGDDDDADTEPSEESRPEQQVQD